MGGKAAHRISKPHASLPQSGGRARGGGSLDAHGQSHSAKCDYSIARLESPQNQKQRAIAPNRLKTRRPARCIFWRSTPLHFCGGTLGRGKLVPGQRAHSPSSTTQSSLIFFHVGQRRLATDIVVETRSRVTFRLYETLAVEAETAAQRPFAQGKFISLGQDKFYVRGVTYGPFRPNAAGSEYHDAEHVDRDFRQMAALGINSVRTYTVPPRWLLDAAWEYGLRVLVGLAWEQHTAFLDDKRRAADIEARVRSGVRKCGSHPAVLGFTVGNEIPSSIVRWYGRRRIEDFIRRLYLTAKSECPDALVTYVNYPSTEYLDLDSLDFLCFNVFLHSQDRLKAYVTRLQNLAGERPLLLGEIGIDSRTQGKQKQAYTLDWQIRTAFESGCAGAFVFSWTDEWHRGGYDIEDWDFGITDRMRKPKPAAEAVQKAYAQVPFSREMRTPRISVIVCSHNGARTLRNCCEGLLELEYPNFEVVVVDDGSTDATASIAREYGFRVISTENGGLSRARNLGMDAASGEIVAYIDDDTRPDPHWLRYLAAAFENSSHAAIGGPNIPPPGDGWVAECVANAPGNPVHVLLSDDLAEHLPGCNLAIRKSCLKAIGGFDPQFRVAGDDVDVCWRLQQKGWTLGFSPAALVWHHRRDSFRAYWKQQRGYGKAEALLENKWPEKYNAAGHFTWSGKVYGKGLRKALDWRGDRIHYGTWGSALFQSVYDSNPGGLWWLPLLPEWYHVILSLAGLAALGILWAPMLIFAPLFLIATGLLVAQATVAASKAAFRADQRSLRTRLTMRAMTFLLHLLQPLARLVGRRWDTVGQRQSKERSWHLPRPKHYSAWSERWEPAEKRLQALEASLKRTRAVVSRGGDYDRWDLHVRGGLFGSARGLLAIEEHGAGRQLVRLKAWPRVAPLGIVSPLVLLSLASWGTLDHVWGAGMVLGAAGLVLALRVCRECGAAMAMVERALQESNGGDGD